jgi:glycosyltransferase involved in cell wall biosynthesis
VTTLGPSRRHWNTLLALRRRLREFDVVVAHGSTTLPVCALATLGTETPFVYRQVSDMLFWAPTRPRRARARLALGRAARVVALWGGAAEVLRERFGVPANRIAVVPNGVDGDHFRPVAAGPRSTMRTRLGLDPGRSVVAYVGALVPEKGVEVAVDAVAALDGVQLLVVGSGSERTSLELRAGRAAPGRVVFTGSVADVRDAYAAADLVILPSRGGDSMPAVLIEAALMGVPAVASRAQAIPDIVVDGETGALVDQVTSRAFAGAIGALLADSGRLHELGPRARAHCLDRFDLAVVTDQWLDVLERTVADATR